MRILTVRAVIGTQLQQIPKVLRRRRASLTVLDLRTVEIDNSVQAGETANSANSFVLERSVQAIRSAGESLKGGIPPHNPAESLMCFSTFVGLVCRPQHLWGILGAKSDATEG